MRYPDFLIIGAMKAGTTTLYFDLQLNPAIFLPTDKEPHSLADDKVLTMEGRAEYAKLFRNAKSNQICGEASTGYTKLPDIAGVPNRAVEVCGKNLNVIYLVREPVARIISHHHHSYLTGLIKEENIDRAVREFPILLNYTRYAMQIKPWIDALGRDNVLIVRFEDYVSNRRETVSEISQFLGVDAQCGEIDDTAVYNRSDSKPLPIGRIARFRNTRLYRRVIRYSVWASLRSSLKQSLLPRSQFVKGRPSDETREFIYGSLSTDLEELQKATSRKRPMWDCEYVSNTDC